MRFCYRMVPEMYQLFWAAMARGEFITDAAVDAGMYRKRCTPGWLRRLGAAARPWLEGPLFELAQREEIALGRARGESVRSIAAALRRAPSTVSRELRRNGDRLGGSRATTAHALAYDRASRPGGMHHVRLPDWSLSVPLRHCAAYPDRARPRNIALKSRYVHVAAEGIPG